MLTCCAQPFNGRIINPVDRVYTAKAAIAYLAETKPLPVFGDSRSSPARHSGVELLRVIRGDERLKSVPIGVLTGLERPGQ